MTAKTSKNAVGRVQENLRVARNELRMLGYEVLAIKTITPALILARLTVVEGELALAGRRLRRLEKNKEEMIGICGRGSFRCISISSFPASCWG